MADYVALKARIAGEMARDDLATDIPDMLDAHVHDACEEFASRPFWFNTIVVSATTVDGEQQLELPGTVRIVDRVAGPYGDLTAVRVEDFPDYGILASNGTPLTFSYIDGGLRLDPVPDDAYSLTIYGIKQIDPPQVDADDNAWTNEAARLITAQVKFTLYRDVFSDAEGVSEAKGAVLDALAWMERETQRRTGARLAARLVAPTGAPMRSRLRFRWF